MAALGGDRRSRTDIQRLFHHWKKEHRRIVGLTAYDYPTASRVAKAGADFAVVGDSVGPVVLGKDLAEVTIEDMVRHAAAVVLGAGPLPVIVDLPVGTYDEAHAARANARRVLGETGASAVKVEGGVEVAGVVGDLVGAGIPAVGHCTPSHLRIKGDASDHAAVITASALAEAGIAALVLVDVPSRVAGEITQALPGIPTLGSHPGAGCNGSIGSAPGLVGLGRTQDHGGGEYASLGQQMTEALRRFVEDSHRLRDGSDESER